MTGYAKPAPFVVTESSNAGWQGWHAFSSNNNHWESSEYDVPNADYANARHDWLAIDLGSSCIITSYAFSGRSDQVAGSQYPRDWKAQGSQDGVHWTDLDSVVDNPQPSVISRYERKLSNSHVLRYFRFFVSRNWGNPRTVIQKIELYGSNLPKKIFGGRNEEDPGEFLNNMFGDGMDMDGMDDGWLNDWLDDWLGDDWQGDDGSLDDGSLDDGDQGDSGRYRKYTEEDPPGLKQGNTRGPTRDSSPNMRDKDKENNNEASLGNEEDINVKENDKKSQEEKGQEGKGHGDENGSGEDDPNDKCTKCSPCYDGCDCGCEDSSCDCGEDVECGDSCPDDCECGGRKIACRCDPETAGCGGVCPEGCSISCGKGDGGKECNCEPEADCGGECPGGCKCKGAKPCSCVYLEDSCNGECAGCECVDLCKCTRGGSSCDGECGNCNCDPEKPCKCGDSADIGEPDNNATCPVGTDNGANPFTLDGNVTREITDLRMTGNEPLEWIRINNSKPRGVGVPFGQGAGWRHNWQYELQSHSSGNGETLRYFDPSGGGRLFWRQKDGTFATSQKRFTEKARMDGERVEITTDEEDVLVFEPAGTLAGQDSDKVYRIITLTSKDGLVTNFDYDGSGLLQHITNDAGNQITLYYEEHAGIPCISRVETSDGRAVDYEYKIRSEPQPKAKTAANAKTPAQTNEPAKPKYAVLKSAHYGDGTSAEYTYAFVTPGREPLLIEADDPRYEGRATHIGYRYQKGLLLGYGAIRQEFNPDTGQAYATLEYNAKTPEKRTVLYSDDRAITYRVPGNTNGRPTMRIDSLGRKSTWSFAKGGAGSLEEKTDADGTHVSYTYDNKGKITRETHNNGLVVNYERDDNGKVIKTHDNRGHIAEYARDSKGRVTQTTKTNNGNPNSNNANANSLTNNGNANGNNGNPNSNNGVGPNGTPPGQAKKEAVAYDAAGRIMRQDYADGTYEEFTRDGKGNVLTKRDRKGGQHKYINAERGLVAAETDPAGATTTYTYDQFGQRTSQTDALNHTTTWERNERGLVTRQTNPDGTTRQYSYDKYGHKTAETDELGRTTAYDYDSLGRMTRQTDSAGGVTRYDYTETPGGCGTCSLVTKPTRIEYPDGRVDEFLYDSEGRLLMGAAAAGTAQEAVTLYAYDEADNLTQQTNPDGGIIRNTYDIDKHRLTTTDPLGRVTTWTYDTDGNMLSTTDASGRTTDYAYDADSNLIYTVTPDGAETTYEYDGAGHRISATDALGNTTRWNYDAVGNLVSMVDAAGGKTTYEYDDAGRLTRAKLPDGTSQTLTYDAIGQVTQTTTPDGLEVTSEYDDMGRVTATTSTTGKNSKTESATTRTTYDAAGRRTSATDPLNRTTIYEYNPRDQVTTTTYPDGTKTQKEYDAAGRVLADIDQLNHVTRYTYTAMGDIATLTDANGNIYTFEYDLMRHKTAMIYPDDTAEQWTYNLGNRITTYTTRASQTKTIAYNLDSRPLAETWQPSGCAPDVTYTYDDATGGLLSADNGNTLLTYTYDKLGRITSETTDIHALLANMAPHTVGYVYDALGRKAGLTYPSGTKVTYAYDAQSRMTEVYNGNHKPLATYEYDAFGRRSKLTRDNGVVTNYTYDSADQVLAIDHLAQNNKALAFVNYEYDNMGRRTAMTRENLQTDTYRYDPTGQLVGVDYSPVGASLATPSSGNNGNGNGNNGNPNSNNGNGNSSSTGFQPVSPRTESFTYDPMGNRLEHTDTGADQPPLFEQYETNHLNQYTQITQQTEIDEPDAADDDTQDPQTNPTVNSKPQTVNSTLAYDANGNLTDDSAQHYTYDAQNRLIEVASTTVKAEFIYDSLNRCILRRYYTTDSNGAMILDETISVMMTYDIAWNILSDCALSGRQTAEYIRGNNIDEILVQICDSESVYTLSDAINNTIMLANQNGSSLGVYRYDAFGKPPGEDVGFRYLYTGREWLPTVGLSEHRNRYYNPDNGRWLSPDPIGFRGGLNVYSFCHNNSLTHIDPFGQDGDWGAFLYQFRNLDFQGWQPSGSVGLPDLHLDFSAGGSISVSGCAPFGTTGISVCLNGQISVSVGTCTKPDGSCGKMAEVSGEFVAAAGFGVGTGWSVSVGGSGKATLSRDTCPTSLQPSVKGVIGVSASIYIASASCEYSFPSGSFSCDAGLSGDVKKRKKPGGNIGVFVYGGITASGDYSF